MTDAGEPEAAEPQRVLVLGSGGSGKSTLARRLGEITTLPIIHLDMLYWRPGWVEPTHAEWSEQLGPVLADPRWIIDGNYGGTAKQRAAAADFIVLLDLPRRVTIPAILKRWLRHRGSDRPDMAPGCPDRMTVDFVRYVWNYRKVSLPKMVRRLHEAGADSVLVLRSRREIEAFIAGWPRTARGGPLPRIPGPRVE